jgi:hypothetical protein
MFMRALGSAQIQLLDDKNLHYDWVISKTDPEIYILHKENCMSIKFRKKEDKRYIPAPDIDYVKKIAAEDRKSVYYCALCFDESRVKGKMYRG